MRLTVGPLPSAVYWRRRAIVVGSLVAVLAVGFASCGGSGSGAPRPGTLSGAAPSSSQPGSPEPTSTLLTPQTGAPASDPADGPTNGPVDEPPIDPVPSLSGPSASGPPLSGHCTNDEITVTPVPAKPVVRRGVPVDLRLRIRNSSSRTCLRDVGGDVQELRLVRGAETTWSSDHCGGARGSDVRSFTPGSTREYLVTWNGRSSGKCANNAPAGPIPAVGAYHLIGRLGTRHSLPVKVTVAS